MHELMKFGSHEACERREKGKVADVRTVDFLEVDLRDPVLRMLRM